MSDRLLLGTSSWTADGWEKAFYPPGLPARDWLAHYATKFPVVEVDATFYRVPAPSTVRRWREVTPDGFLMAAKVPKEITHDKLLADCADDLKRFVDVMDLLGDRLGPLLIQVQYLNRKAMPTPDAFLARLEPFLGLLPSGRRWALEIRNKAWIRPPLLEMLRARNVALALIDHPWMPRPGEFADPESLLTADFAYIRWLGDRHAIEERTKTWDRTILDRTEDLRGWVPLVRRFLATGRWVFAFANNHYAGHAPSTLDLFHSLWKAMI